MDERLTDTQLRMLVLTLEATPYKARSIHQHELLAGFRELLERRGADETTTVQEPVGSHKAAEVSQPERRPDVPPHRYSEET